MITELSSRNMLMSQFNVDALYRLVKIVVLLVCSLSCHDRQI